MAIFYVAPQRVPGGYAHRGPLNAGDTLVVFLDSVTTAETNTNITVRAPAGLTIAPSVTLSAPETVRPGGAIFVPWAKGNVTAADVQDGFDGRASAVQFAATGAGAGTVEVVV